MCSYMNDYLSIFAFFSKSQQFIRNKRYKESSTRHGINSKQTKSEKMKPTKSKSHYHQDPKTKLKRPTRIPKATKNRANHASVM